MADDLPILWQLRFSHYNEKARWALDWKGVEHERRSWLPGPHVARALRLTRRRTFPILKLDGEAIGDSTRIIAALEARHPDPPLYPADPAERERALALEDFFDEQLGAQLRRAVFYDALPQTGFAAGAMSVGFAAAARAAYRLAFPLLRPVIKRALGVDAAGAEDGWAKTHAALDRIEVELDGRQYLVGERFSVADLTACALFLPLAAPPEFPYPLPDPGSFPGRTGEEWRELSERPGLQWVRETYRRHRGSSTAVNESPADPSP